MDHYVCNLPFFYKSLKKFFKLLHLGIDVILEISIMELNSVLKCINFNRIH